MPASWNQTYGFSLLTFGFFTAVALVAAIYMFREEAKATGCDLQRIDGLCFWMLIAAIFGARLSYFAIHPEALSTGVSELLKIWNGGVSFAGGAAAAVAVGLGYMRRFRMPLLRTLDALAPAVAIGQFFGWLGCFFSGFCRLQSAGYAWAPPSAAGMQLHPTALFIAAGHFVVFGLLLLLKQRRRCNGQTFWIYLLLLGVMGMIRGAFFVDADAGHLFGLPHCFIGSAALAAAAMAGLLVVRRRAGKRNVLDAAGRNGGSN